MRDGVILVRVALGAGRRRSHPGRHGGIHTVDHRSIAKFLVASTALVVRFGIAMKGRRNELILGGIGKQVSCDLFDGELIKRHIRIKRADDPIAIGPDRATGIVGIARRVRIACEV